jgi:quinol monooxygenase YgiN
MALLNSVFEAMKVEETFVSATALRSAEDPGSILLYENWIDRENFMSVQLKRPYALGTRHDCQSFSAPPAGCRSSSRSSPCHSLSGGSLHDKHRDTH